jgi:hypothetical protein
MMRGGSMAFPGKRASRRLPTGDVPGERSMTPLAGPLLASFWMYEEIDALRHLIPNDFVLYLALAGLLLTLLLDFRTR